MRDPRNIMEINLPDVDTSRRYGVMDEPKIKQHWSITLLPCAKIAYLGMQFFLIVFWQLDESKTIFYVTNQTHYTHLLLVSPSSLPATSIKLFLITVGRGF